jgi:hypothetical protein
MSNRINGFIVTLSREVSEETAERITTAISLIGGVVSVKPVVSDHNTHIAEQRVRTQIAGKLHDVIWGNES